MLFAGSLLLPALSLGTASPPMLGWEAAQTTWLIEWEFVTKEREPNGASRANDAYWMVWYSSMNLCNLLMVLSPWYAWRLYRDRGGVFAVILATAVVGAWFVPFVLSGLRVGYYVWCVSLTALANAQRLSYRTLLLACCFAAVLVATALLFPNMN